MSELTKAEFIVLIIIIIIVVVVIIIAFRNCLLNDKPEDLYQKKTVPVRRFRNFLVKPTSEQKIPRVIMQTNSDSRVPCDMNRTIESILENNPEYQYIYFDDMAAREFIVKEYGGRVVEAYDDLNPGAFKADLFRYCYIYKRGGVYIDTGMVCISPLKDLIRADDEFVAPEDNLNGTGVYNAFMCSIPGHPIIGRVLRICLRNIERKDKTVEMLTLTGPGALCQAFVFEIGKDPVPNTDYGNGVRLIRHVGGNRLHKESNSIVGEIDQDGHIIMKTKYPTYYLDRVWYHSKQHYGVLWSNDEVFNSVIRGERKPNSDDKVGCPPQIIPCEAEQFIDHVVIHAEPTSTEHLESQDIPRVIVQTNEKHNVPLRMADAMEELRKLNPEYAYEYFDARRRRFFIRDNFKKEVLVAYDSLNPGAFQADLFRYCYLYRKGGVYTDSGTKPLKSLKHLIKKHDKLIIAEDDGGKRAWNGFMCAVPKLKIFKLMIKSIVKNCQEKFYGGSALDITGPNLLGGFFKQIYGSECQEDFDYSGHSSNNHHDKHDSEVRVIRYASSYTVTGRRCHEPGEIIYKGKTYFLSKYDGYYEDMSWYQKKDQYDVYWQLRQVYI